MKVVSVRKERGKKTDQRLKFMIVPIRLTPYNFMGNFAIQLSLGSHFLLFHIKFRMT